MSPGSKPLTSLGLHGVAAFASAGFLGRRLANTLCGSSGFWGQPASRERDLWRGGAEWEHEGLIQGHQHGTFGQRVATLSLLGERSSESRGQARGDVRGQRVLGGFWTAGFFRAPFISGVLF